MRCVGNSAICIGRDRRDRDSGDTRTGTIPVQHILCERRDSSCAVFSSGLCLQSFLASFDTVATAASDCDWDTVSATCRPDPRRDEGSYPGRRHARSSVRARRDWGIDRLPAPFRQTFSCSSRLLFFCDLSSARVRHCGHAHPSGTIRSGCFRDSFCLRPHCWIGVTYFVRNLVGTRELGQLVVPRSETLPRRAGRRGREQSMMPRKGVPLTAASSRNQWTSLVIIGASPNNTTAASAFRNAATSEAGSFFRSKASNRWDVFLN